MKTGPEPSPSPRWPRLAALVLAALAATALCQEPVPLTDTSKPNGGWEFDNGREFPGAQGKLEVSEERFRDKPVLSLSGDFTGGGNYVQASIALPGPRLDTVSFWVHTPAGSTRLPIRLMDVRDKVHQLNLRLNEKGGWQHLVVPVQDFFKKMGTPDALDIVVQYETWDGVADSKRHGKPLRSGPRLAILASRAMGTLQGTIRFCDVLYHPSGGGSASVAKTIELDELLRAGEADWGFNLGQEFAGAKGGLEVVSDEPAKGQFAMKLHADFREGGAYVGARKSFAQLDVQAMSRIRMRMRSKTARSFALRLVDATGQCHQRKGIALEADGQWHEVELVPTEIAGGEHWGGANDGKWHDPVRLVELMLNVASHEGKTPELLITDIRADVTVEAEVAPAAYAESFEGEPPPEKPWQTAGKVAVAGPGRGGKGRALVLERALDQLETPTWATGTPFGAAPGLWQVEYAWKADLHSPDNSYHGAVALEVLDRGGRVLETLPLGIGYGKGDWQVAAKPVEISPGAAAARFHVRLNKTYGSFRLDDLSAARLSAKPIERRIERVLLATAAVGNLFLPGDDVAFDVTVEAVKPLSEGERVVRHSVRDTWGAEQLPPGEVALAKAPRQGGRFIYKARIDLPEGALAAGKFYELHVEIPQGTGEAAKEFSGLAVLPPAATKSLEPERVPFTIRNWDSRIPVYFRLADRLGLRLMGVWGGWSPKPPYKPHCPGIDLCKELGAKWITGTPASSVERKGFAEYSEEALRQGMRAFLEQFADRGLAMIAMGNEPHGTGEKVLDNVRAYRAVYEAVKAVDPKIHVIGTSVEPNEEYFKAGYQNYLDSYDFHIYEHYTNVRRTMREYRALMEKYRAVKPIHSTELGLNSQGQTRRAVAIEMIKKCTVFFAEGGATVSWFTIQYPDPKGKARGEFGDAHCVFDCKYSLYNPRLDAITYYHVVNGIADKKFVEEKHYPNGVQAYLFRDGKGNCLQVLWLDGRREDVLVPLPAAQKVDLIHLDGSHTALTSAAGGLTLSISEEPLLLLYTEATGGLGGDLGAPALSLAEAPAAVRPGETATFVLKGPDRPEESLKVRHPALWKAAVRRTGEGVFEVTAQAPATTPAREARLEVQLVSDGNVVGELTLAVRVARTGS